MQYFYMLIVEKMQNAENHKLPIMSQTEKITLTVLINFSLYIHSPGTMCLDRKRLGMSSILQFPLSLQEFHNINPYFMQFRVLVPLWMGLLCLES